MKERLLTLLIILCVPLLSWAQITVSSAAQSGNWADYYVNEILLGAGVTAFNATFTGCDTTFGNNMVGYDSAQISEFVNAGSVVDIPDGLFLTTGSSEALAGQASNPNPGPSASDGVSDPDLQALLPSFNLHNSAVLEFDFVPQGDTIRFKYVFGSLEYPGFVCSNFNDVFGFFLSGPGINGPFTNNAENLAVVPGTTTPVAINTINDIPGGNACNPACPCNSQYFVNNYTAPVDTNVAFGGLTVALEAVAEVICGDTYHIKMAIADAGDGILDSGVFLEGGSFTSNLIEVNIATVNGDSTINEGCGEADILFTRGDTTDTSISILTFTGTATNGVDFDLIPDTIILLPGMQDTIITITPYADGLNEGVETFTIQALSVTLCGDTFISEGTLYIHDTASLRLAGPPDTSFTCPPDSVPVFVQVLGGGPPPYSYLWPNGDTTASTSLQVSPDGGVDTFIVAVQDSCMLKTFYDTILVFKNYEDDPNPVILNDSLVNCAGDLLDLELQITDGTAPLSWIWSTGDTTTNTTVEVNGSQQVFVTITDACGRVVIDTADLGVKVPDSVSVKFPDTLVYCLGSELTINPRFKGGVEPLTFAWEQTNPTFDDDSIRTLTINGDTTAYFWVQDACGIEYNTDFFIDALEVDSLTAFLDSTSGRCAGDTFELNPMVRGGLAPLTYQWSTGDTDTVIVFEGSVSQNISVTVTDFCNNQVEAQTLVDVPEYAPMEIFLSGDGTVCYGDEFTFHARIQGGAGDYRFEWTPQNEPILGERFESRDSNTYSVISKANNIHYLTVNDFCGNALSDTVTITVEPCVFIPNVITPNGDGLNDAFYIENITSFEDAHLFIYNRWGQRVFESKPYRNEWVPLDASPGTYYYILRSRNFEELRGNLTILNEDEQ
jgi:gliding motility-associated-like protein